ncbi:MAG TPA: Maf family protein [Candidatus Binataceae bacterium]|nr:Maf family protein [Candidatus Binataceae bacterium]
MADESELILASGSPRRRELLAAAGLKFTIVESGVDETRGASETAENYALRVAGDKALAVSRRIPERLVLGADTVVELDGEVLLKPLDAADARRMLNRLSGRTHTVITAYAIALGGRILASEPVIAQVRFRVLIPQEVEAYINTGEPFDKAGAYGIQGDGAKFIVDVVGERDTVMGLPVRPVLEALRRCARDAVRE